MQNPILNKDHTLMTCSEWEAIANRSSIGDTYFTNIPGTVGHNYAKWEIVKIASKVVEGHIEVTSKRLN